MEIQTFEIEEAVGGTTPEIEAAAVELVEQLGLKGQKRLITGEGDKKERFQYPQMTKIEEAVYEEVLPQHSALEEYDAGSIPVRILQVAAHAKGFCDSIEVWHKAVRDPDPLLVGIKGKSKYDNHYKRYCLARWGDALKDFSGLLKEARTLMIARLKRELGTKVVEVQSQLDQVEGLVEKRLAGQWIPV